jgi:hypothetical protein
MDKFFKTLVRMKSQLTAATGARSCDIWHASALLCLAKSQKVMVVEVGREGGGGKKFFFLFRWIKF